MKKAKLLKTALLVTVLAALYLFSQGGQVFVKQAPPLPPEVKTEPPAASVSPAPPETVSSGDSAAAQSGGQSGSLTLAPVPRGQDTLPANSDYSYTIKNEKKELQILPGVTYAPRDGVSIKTSSKDEVIQLQRDHSSNTDYQVLWKKKF